MRAVDSFGIVPILEPKDNAAGLDLDSFKLSGAAGADLVLLFGALTGNALLTLFCGATKGAKTTAIGFRYRLANADFKVAAADQYAAEATATSAGLTLTATTYDHRCLLVHLDASEVVDGKPWITAVVDGTASVQLSAAIALLTNARYQPPPTNLT